MTEVKNSFLGSKMNKDLDDRLIPNNEYRDALNISIGKSEGDSIGVAQTSLGNLELVQLDGEKFETLKGLTCIGYFSDNKNNRIYQFLTNYTDQTPSLIMPPSTTRTMKITVYDPAASPVYRTLVSGTFLNFSKTNIITGVNLIEDLLFFTDNRNQPRKINVTKAFNDPNYYYTETQISVAKYAPVDPISLIRKETVTAVSGNGADWVLSNTASLACTIGAVAGAPTGPYTATITTAVADGFSTFLVGDVIAGNNGTGSFGVGPVVITSIISSTSINVSSINIFSAGTASITLRYPYVGAIQTGATVLSSSAAGVQFLRGSDYAFVKSINNTTLSLYEPTTEISAGYTLTFLNSTMSNQANTPGWPGDPSFLEDKFIRFSYRFKFDDNEYSLLAPFTQIAYIPKQKGYFIAGNEANAYQSTVVNWFENNVNNIELLIPFPDKCSLVANSYKITDLEILYKESDAATAYVIDSIPIDSQFGNNNNSNIYTYSYQSQKPYKTLNPDQITRVYDNVPVRALAQEVSGNRVIYGNFHTTYAAPRDIDYNTSVTPKQDIFDSFIEYPNHTVKQNRNYQVGFVLSDKFGRSSSVILSSVDAQIAQGTANSLSIGGSTLYAPYQAADQANFPDVREWFGNALTLLINREISSIRDIPNGTPGLYAIPTSTNGFSIVSGATINVLDSGFYLYQFTLDNTAGIQNTVPVASDYLRGKYTDYVKVSLVSGSGTGPYTVYTNGEINDLYLFNPAIGGPATKYSYKLNEIGWYSYKVVVKQQQQDYYNVYLPGMLQGYPEGQTYGSQVVYTGAAGSTPASTVSYNGINTTSFPVGESQKISHIVLINDNINKVPRDLTEVGPDQKQYRSSVQLFGKVQNKAAITTLFSNPTITNLLESTLTYDTTDPLNAGASEIRIGDGIQNDGANTPIPIPGSSPTTYAPNGNRWYADTVVTSHTIVGTTGTITWSPTNITQNSSVAGYATYRNFTITRAENAQYFPTRKGDTVSSIATANDFNFIANDVNNIKGTSAVNFYQLQTNPLIGRVSTVNPIGVIASEMIPFLSVYETTPEVSALALFWETATTGIISDLNWDILTGFDGPSRLSDFVFDFWEDQDPTGLNPVTGAADSKYITDPFQILNATGLALSFNSIQITNITPDSSINLPKFAIETLPGNQYRLYITDTFVFNSGAATNSNFTFTITVDLNGVLYPVYITGRLKNRPPSFLLPNYNSNVGRVVADIVTVTAENGSATTNSALKIQDLSWAILSGNNSNYFTIGRTTGTIRLIDASIPVGSYPLEIQVSDAMNTTTDPSTPLTNTDLDLATKTATITVFITVGEVSVNSGLEFFSTGDGWVYTIPGGVSGTETCTSVPGQGWGAVYIGTQDVSLTADYTTSAGPGYVLPFPFESNVWIGTKIIVSGTNIGAGSIIGYSNPTTYYVVGVEFDANFFFLGWKLGLAPGAAPVDITAGSLTGLSFKVFDISGGTNPNLPLPNQFFQYTVNVEIANGKAFNSTNPPTGLLQGELEFTVNNFVSGWFGQSRSSGTIWWVYYRQDPSYPWALIGDTNGTGGGADGLGCGTGPAQSSTQTREKKFVQNIPGEYCVILKNECQFFIQGDGGPDSLSGCNEGFDGGGGVIVRDANYAYGGDWINPGPFNPGPPLAPVAQKYYLAGQEYTSNAAIPGYPTGVPLPVQDAVLGFGPVIPTSPIANNPINGNLLYLTASDAQLVKGMKYIPSTINFGPTVTASSAGSTTITLTGGTTAKMVVGMSIKVNSNSGGFGLFDTGTVITSITNSTTFVVNVLPISILSGRTFTVSNAWFTPTTNVIITDFENGGTTLVLSSVPTMISGIIPVQAKIPFGFPVAADDNQSNFNRGIVYAPAHNPSSPNIYSYYQINPINIKQFFIDEALSIPWSPPVAGKAYNFMTSEPFSFVTGTPTQNSMKAITKYPYFSAFFDANGKVIPQTTPLAPTIMTIFGEYAIGNSGAITYNPVNTSRNMWQDIKV